MSNAIGSALGNVRKLPERIGKVAYATTLVVLSMMMLLTVVDVLGRYVFNKPITGGLEITQFMMAAVVFLGLGYAQFKKAHISVTFLVDKLSRRVQTSMRLATDALSLGLTALLLIQGWRQAVAYAGESALSPILELPVVPFFSVVVLGFLFLGLVQLTDMFGAVRRIEGNRERWLLSLPGCLLLLLVAAGVVLQPQLPQVGPALSGLMVVVLLLALIFSGIPVAYALGIAGLLGLTYLLGTGPAFEVLTKRPFLTAASYTMSVVPLFVLMGFLCLYSGIGKDIYHSLNKWLGHLPGGLAIATIGGCAAFAAVTGASVACAVAIGVIAIPEMMKYKYSPSLATGTVAAGGTLGILIPPSITFIVYGVLTQQSIAKLFIAGIIPGIMLAIMMMLYIYLHARYRPAIAPRGPSASLGEKVTSLRHTWPVLVLFGTVMGGLYAGVFTPTEGGGIGAFGALIVGLGLRGFTRRGLVDSLLKTVDTTCMVMFIFIGAEILSLFFAHSRLPFMMSEFAMSLTVPGFVILLLFLLILLILGCIMPVLPVVILLVPIMYPTVITLGYDPIWFGVIVVILTEMGLITPPVGNNVYAIASVAKDVPMEKIFKGILPFVVVMIVFVVVLMAFPQIALFLPNLMK